MRQLRWDILINPETGFVAFQKRKINQPVLDCLMN